MELADDGSVLLSVEATASKLCDNDDSPAIVCELLGVDEDPGSKSDKMDPIPPGDDEDGVADDGATDDDAADDDAALGEVGLLLGVLEVAGLDASGADDSSSQSSSSSASGAADCAVAPAAVLATAVVGAAAACDDDDTAAGELAAAVAVLPVIPFTKSLKKFLFSCCCIPSALAKAIKATQIEVNVDTFIFLTLSISDL